MCNWKQILSNKKGSSLVVVIVVFAVVMILGTAVLSVVSHSYQNSSDTHRQQQAYYTARSAMDTVLNTLKNTTTCAELSSKLQDGTGTTITGTGSIPSMGDYKVELTHDIATKRVKVEVTGTFKGQTSKLFATLKEGKGSRLNPLDFVFFNKWAGITGLDGNGDQIKINGNVYAKVAAEPRNLDMTGNYMTYGTFKLLGGSKIIGNLYVNGHVEVQAPNGKVEGKLYTTMDTIANATDITGVTKDKITMANPQDTPTLVEGLGFFANVEYQQTAWNSSCIKLDPPSGATSAVIDGYGKITFATELLELKHGGSIQFSTENKFYGIAAGLGTSITGNNFDCGFGIKADAPAKKVTFPDGAVLDFDAKTFTFKSGSGDDEKKADYTWLGDIHKVTSYVGGTLDINEELLGDVYVSNNGTVKKNNFTPVLNNTGNINISNDSKLSSSSFTNATITIDATLKDIMLTTDDSLIMENTKILIKGNKKVYLFFEKDKQFLVKRNCILGVNSGTNTALNQFYVVGEKLKMTLGGNSVLMGTAYMNNGSYDEGTSPDTGIVKVQGCIVANIIEITKGNTYNYIEPAEEPMFNATLPDNYFVCPKLTENQINWKIDKYGK